MHWDLGSLCPSLNGHFEYLILFWSRSNNIEPPSNEQSHEQANQQVEKEATWNHTHLQKEWMSLMEITECIDYRLVL